MTNQNTIPWKRLVAEGSAIVVSILLAFWIDAWWDRSQQREQQNVMLESLLSDLRDKQMQVVWQRRFNEGILESAMNILLAANNAGSNLDTESVDKLIGGIIWANPSRQWVSAPLSHMVIGGELSVLDDTDLIEKLSKLYILFEDVKSSYESDEKFYAEMLIPFLITNANLGQIMSSIEMIPGHALPYESAIPNMEITQSHVGLLSEAKFQGIVSAKIDLLDGILASTLPDLEEAITETIEILEVAIAE